MDKHSRKSQEPPTLLGLPLGSGSGPVGPDLVVPDDDQTQADSIGSSAASPRPVDPPNQRGEEEVESGEALPSWTMDVSHHSSWFTPESPKDTPGQSGPFETDFSAVSDLGSANVKSSGSTPMSSEPTPTDDFDADDLAPNKLVEGTVLFNKYTLKKKLGEGGMGEVWKVHHNGLEQDRALKFIRAGLSQSPELRKRFHREARAMAKVVHDNAVVIHDAFTKGGMAFIDMALVDGKSLVEILKPGQPMPLDWTLRILEQLCEVLAVAHKAGIVHRDLKPANLMLVNGRAPGRESLKVLDFGIAKLINIEEKDVSITNGGPIGTYPYMSPEQFGYSAATVDTRSDIYTVGVILFEFLTGFRPFSGKNSMYQWAELHIKEPVPTFRDKNPNVDVSPEIEAVVRRCMAKLPADRPQSALELFQEFQAASGLLRPLTRTGTGTSDPATVTEKPKLTGSLTVEPLPGTVQDTPVGTDRALKGSRDKSQTIGSVAQSETIVDPLLNTVTKVRNPWLLKALAACTLLVGLIVAGVGVVAVKFAPFRLVSSGHVWKDRAYSLYKHPFDRQDIYLPEDYSPVGTDRAEDGWPKVIVRDDGVEFVRIAGTKSYKSRKPEYPSGGDPEANVDLYYTSDDPPEDRERVFTSPGYYIQRYEVTNREVARVAEKGDPKVIEKLKAWSDWYDNEESNPKGGKDCDDSPAFFLSREAAKEIARYFKGVLPGRDQWEFAASSRGARKDYVWGKLPEDGLKSIGINKPRARPGTDFRADETEQHVFNMGGNLREWTLDDRSRTDDPQTKKPVACGGCFNDSEPLVPAQCGIKAAHDDLKHPDNRVGMRVLLECPSANDMAPR